MIFQRLNKRSLRKCCFLFYDPHVVSPFTTWARWIYFHSEYQPLSMVNLVGWFSEIQPIDQWIIFYFKNNYLVGWFWKNHPKNRLNRVGWFSPTHLVIINFLWVILNKSPCYDSSSFRLIFSKLLQIVDFCFTSASCFTVHCWARWIYFHSEDQPFLDGKPGALIFKYSTYWQVNNISL